MFLGITSRGVTIRSGRIAICHSRIAICIAIYCRFVSTSYTRQHIFLSPYVGVKTSINITVLLKHRLGEQHI